MTLGTLKSNYQSIINQIHPNSIRDLGRSNQKKMRNTNNIFLTDSQMHNRVRLLNMILNIILIVQQHNFIKLF